MVAGTSAIARDLDGSSIAYKCSNESQMWLQNASADAAGASVNYALEANGGTVFTRGFSTGAATLEVYSGGSVTPF